MLLFYIRHGQPIYNPDSLTETGHEQARAVCKRLATYNIDRIFSSPSNRAIQTATPLSQTINKEIDLLHFCDESIAWGEFTVKEDEKRKWAFQSKQWVEAFNRNEIRFNEKWYENEHFSSTCFGKGIERINNATDEWLLQPGYKHDRELGRYQAIKPNRERVALFAHQGFGMAFLSSILDIPYPLFCTRFDMGCSEVSVIEFGSYGEYIIPKLLTLSNDGHLYKENLKTAYDIK